MESILRSVNAAVWGVPTLVLILGVGLYISIRTGFAQFTLFPRALKRFFAQFRGQKDSTSGVTPWQALCTALAATVGTGNLAGVAGAMAIGGPGAIFWMWICAALGMATKYAEATLAVRFRVREKGGKFRGGYDSHLDLFFASEKHEGWINIYLDADNSSYVGTCIYKSKEESEESGKKWSCYITTLKIEWEG